MRRFRLVGIVLAILLVQGAALANPVAQAMFNELLDFQGWLATFDEGIEVYREPIFNFAVALSSVGAIFGIVYKMLTGSTDVLDTLSKIVFAGILLGASPAINDSVISLWDGARGVATQNLKTEYQDAAVAFKSVGESTVDIMVTSAIYANNPSFVGTRIAEQVTGWDRYQRVRDRLAQVTNFALPMLMIAVLTMFFLIVMSGLVITLAGVILPFAAAALTFPGSLGSSLLSSYVRAVMGSLLTVFLFPLVMSVVFDLTATRPAERLATALEVHNTEMDTMVNGINAQSGTLNVEAIENTIAQQSRELSEYKNNPANRDDAIIYRAMPISLRPWLPGRAEGYRNLERALTASKQARETNLEAYETRLAGIMTNGMASFGRNINQWVYSMIFMVTMLIIGIFLLFRFESYIASIVGGIVLGAGGALAAMAVAAGAAGLSGVGFSMPGLGSRTSSGKAIGQRSPAPHSRSNVTPKAIGSGSRGALGSGSSGGGLATRGSGLVPGGGGGGSYRTTAYVIRPAIGGGKPPALPGNRRALGSGRPALPPPKS